MFCSWLLFLKIRHILYSNLVNSNSNNAGTSKIEPSFTGDTANAFLTKDLVKRTLPGNIKP